MQSDRWSSQSQPYRQPQKPVSDDDHCAAIARISNTLSREFEEGRRHRSQTSYSHSARRPGPINARRPLRA